MKTKTATKYPKETIGAHQRVRLLADVYVQATRACDHFASLCGAKGLDFVKVIEDIRN